MLDAACVSRRSAAYGLRHAFGFSTLLLGTPLHPTKGWLGSRGSPRQPSMPMQVAPEELEFAKFWSLDVRGGQR
jgi:hypothetical protein